jgi:hypothetical protein
VHARATGKIVLTPTRAVPRHWFGDLRGKGVLCLASGGGQQVPVLAERGEPAEFSHSLDAQIGGQLDAGIVLTDLFEDSWTDEAMMVNRYSPAFTTRSVKPAPGSVTGR